MIDAFNKQERTSSMRPPTQSGAHENRSNTWMLIRCNRCNPDLMIEWRAPVARARTHAPRHMSGRVRTRSKRIGQE
ncbi:hypothetical protein Y032_0020g194 [Ancylostoma ceylanicum]|uniref:Uncharacterized protein n=1 Tax=Ancylostoma ceylanicum TaxID=53326 RepID=A0A016V2X1_9BILA|nr:hypothetical protein Y032_0020g194 [Ancylostoma ceylanicum]